MHEIRVGDAVRRLDVDIDPRRGRGIAERGHRGHQTGTERHRTELPPRQVARAPREFIEVVLLAHSHSAEFP